MVGNPLHKYPNEMFSSKVSPVETATEKGRRCTEILVGKNIWKFNPQAPRAEKKTNSFGIGNGGLVARFKWKYI